MALGDADFVATGDPEGATDADAEAVGLGSRDGLGSVDGTTTTSGEGVGSGLLATLSRSQTKYVPSRTIIRMITTMVMLRLMMGGQG